MTKTPIQPQEKYVLRFPDGMRERIKVVADASGRSMNAEIVARLEESLSNSALQDGERRKYERRMNVLLDQEARTKDHLMAALGALRRKDLEAAERILEPLAWYQRIRDDFIEDDAMGADDERS